MPPPKEKKLPKHHYIPVFYLKQWAGDNGQLCEFSRKYKQVKPRRTSPDGTGYVRGLYRLPNVAEDRADIIETAYMGTVDNDAARALQILTDKNSGLRSLTEKMKVHWARFLHCMILRSPEYLASIEAILQRDAHDAVESYRETYASTRTDKEPATFEEFKMRFLANPLNTSAARIIHRLVNSETIVRKLCEMRWHVAEFSNPPNLLLTSDRPLVMTNGIGIVGGHIGLPVSPRQLFIAFNDEQGYRSVRAIRPKELIRTVNAKVVEQARAFVYGLSDDSLHFVSKRLGTQRPATPLETGILKRAS
jgi:hypothetical protein